MACRWDGVWMDGREKKSALPKKNCGYRGYREDSTAGVWRGQGLFMVRHLEMAVFLRLCGGGKMVVDGGFFGKMLKKMVKEWIFFVFFVILRD